MAKKPGINKTQAVADYLKVHPKAKSSAIAEALNKKGITITAGHAANIKSKIKRLRRARKAGAAKPTADIPASPALSVEARPAAKPSDTLTIQHVKTVAQTVKTIGGFERLKEVLEVIREVGGLKKFKDLIEAMAATEADAVKS